jgi:hypothetical protein
MSKLEELTVELHNHLWRTMGVTDDWTIQIGGTDEDITKLIEILNQIQEEMKQKGYHNTVWLGNN